MCVDRLGQSMSVQEPERHAAAERGVSEKDESPSSATPVATGLPSTISRR